MHFRFSHSHLPALVLLFFLFLLPMDRAHARVSAEAELGFVDYRAATQSGNVKASSFQQRYSLLLNSAGRFAGDAGRFDYTLGYEWGGIKATTDVYGERTDITTITSHFLYQGDLTYRPRTAPVRLRLFANDTNGLNFYSVGLGGAGTAGSVLSSDIATRILYNKRTTKGGTLVVGGPEGFFSFADMPTLAVEYRESDTESFNSQLASNLKSRDFATYLNRKDNWIHYTLSESSDSGSPVTTTEQRILIGNVDRVMRRHWVELTNWISVSADGSYLNSNVGGAGLKKEYYLNLFGIFSGKKWEGRSFNSFSRSDSDGAFLYQSRIPLYLDGTWNSTTDWHLTLLHEENKTVQGAAKSSSADSVASLSLTTFKSSLFTFSPVVSVDKTESPGTDSLQLLVRLETASSRRFSDRMSLSGGYEFKTRDTSGTHSSTFTSHQLHGRFSYSFRNNMRLEISEVAATASGYSPATPFSNVPVVNDRAEMNRAGMMSVTDAKLVWHMSSRLDYHASISGSFAQYPSAASDGHDITHTSYGGYQSLLYTGSRLKFGTTMSYQHDKTDDKQQTSYSLKGNGEWAISRSMQGALRYGVSRQESPGYATSTIQDVTQSFVYLYSPRDGMDRVLAEIAEEFTYSSTVDMKRHSDTNLVLVGKAYPLRRLYLLASFGYHLLEPERATTYTGTGEVGISYSKLQANLSYSYGRRTTYDARIDQRLTANVKKVF